VASAGVVAPARATYLEAPTFHPPRAINEICTANLLTRPLVSTERNRMVREPLVWPGDVCKILCIKYSYGFMIARPRPGTCPGLAIACLSPEAAAAISADLPAHPSRSRPLRPASSLMSTFVLAIACSVAALFAISANSVTPAPAASCMSSAPPRPLQLQVRHSSSFSLFHRFGLAISSSCRCHGALEQIALVTIGRMDMPFALFGPTDRMPLLVRDQAHSSRWI